MLFVIVFQVEWTNDNALLKISSCPISTMRIEEIDFVKQLMLSKELEINYLLYMAIKNFFAFSEPVDYTVI